jgi:hypothetical protein
MIEGPDVIRAERRTLHRFLDGRVFLQIVYDSIREPPNGLNVFAFMVVTYLNSSV